MSRRRLRPQHEEARVIKVQVFHIASEDVQPVGFGGQGRGDGRRARSRVGGQIAGGSGGVIVVGRIDPHFPQRLLALHQGLMMGAGLPHVGQRGPRRGHQAMLHAQDKLGLDVEVVIDEQVVGGDDRPGQRVLHRQHTEMGAAALQRLDDLQEGATRQGSDIRAEVAAGGFLGIGAVLALEGDDGWG